jgi:hypothetical protein
MTITEVPATAAMKELLYTGIRHRLLAKFAIELEAVAVAAATDDIVTFATKAVLRLSRMGGFKYDDSVGPNLSNPRQLGFQSSVRTNKPFKVSADTSMEA